MTNDEILRIVVASRASGDVFFKETATGRSLALYMEQLPQLQLRLHDSNRLGLPSIYNAEIEACREDPAILIFMHDDVLMTDFWWWLIPNLALKQFRLFGAVGSTVRLPRQATWQTIDGSCLLAREAIVGFVGIGAKSPPDRILMGRATGDPVRLLAGFFLCCHSATLIESGIRFDERFAFHFLDTDFCRQFETRGLSMGTWHVSLIHQSDGLSAIGTEAWNSEYRRYLDKWGE